MSGYVLPALPGQKFPKRKTPVFNTKPYSALSGKEARVSFRAYPLYEFEMEFESLPDNRLPTGAARTNYIPYSNDATQGAGTFGGTGIAPVISANYTAAPDGTLTADRVILNQGSGVVSADYCTWGASQAAPIGTQFTASLWIKTNDGGSYTILFALPNGGYAAAAITPVWTRISATGNLSAALAQVQIALYGASASTVTHADLSVWGAQAEPGAYATQNIFTNGTPVRVSDLKTLASFFSQMLGQYDTFLYQDPDFNTVTLQNFATGNGTATLFNLLANWAPGAEIPQYTVPASILGATGSPDWVQNSNGQPQIFTGRYGGPELMGYASRENLALQSNFVSGWTATNATIAAAAVTSPDGTTDGATLNEGTATGQHSIKQAITITGGGRYTFSAWLKYNSAQYAQLGIYNGASDYVVAAFDLVNGLALGIANGGTSFCSSADATITPFPNGWYRVQMSGALASGDTTADAFIAMMPNATVAEFPSYTGTSRLLDIWGAQFEAGTVCTALIPTTTAQVTESADYTLTELTTAGSVWTFQQVSFTTAPANNVPILWSGSFYYRCRFSDDKTDFQQNMAKLWENGTLAFQSILL